TRSSLLDEFLEHTLAQVPKNGPWRFIGILWQCSFNLGINMPSNHKQIGKTIIVEIDDACSPAHVTSFNSNARGPSSILEICFSVVVIKDVCIVREVRFE